MALPSRLLLLATVASGLVPSLEPLLWLPLGDSITLGCGSHEKPRDTDYAHCAPTAAGYRVPLAYALTQQGYSVSTMGTQTNGPAAWVLPQWLQHEGHPGMSIVQVLDDGHLNKSFAHASARGSSPGLITVHLGTNDCAVRIKHSRHGPVERYSAVQVAAHASALLAAIYERAPRARVFMASVIHYPRERSCVEGFNALLPGVVASHAALGMQAVYVPLAESEQLCATNSTEGGLRATGLCLGDQTHPTAAGYLRIAAVFSLAIAEAFAVRKYEA